MPKLNYNGETVTHIIATRNVSQNGVTLVDGEHYGVDHYYDVSLNWWRIALNNNLARIMQPEEYPEPQFAEGRLRRHRQFADRRVLVIATPRVTTTQLKALLEMDDILFQHIIFNRTKQGVTNRMAIVIKIERDENGDIIVPDWVRTNYSQNGNGIILHVLTVHEAKKLIRATDTFRLDEGITDDDIVIECADRQVTGKQTYEYLKRVENAN